LLGSAASLIVVGRAHAGASEDDSSGAILLLLVIGLACYFLPTIIAMSRGKANGTGGVFFVSLALGWTVIGWFVSFIWACSGQTNSQVRREEERHRELMSAMKAKHSR
jgi:heme/copper-type cytochrome/quinol oxidase subunit 2